MRHSTIIKKNHLRASIKKFFYFLFVFFLFLSVLLYFFFPYKMVKNYIESGIQVVLMQNEILADIKIGSVSPYWLSGIQLNHVSIQTFYQNQRHPFEMKELTVRLSLLPFIIGRAHINAQIYTQSGKAKFFVYVPALSFIRGNVKKFKIEAEFKNFDLEGLADQYFGILENSQNPNLALFLPILENSSLGGYLNGDVNVKSDNGNQNGHLKLNIKNGYFLVNDSRLNIPLQNFKQAQVEISWKDNLYKIFDNTAFESENFYLKSNGSIQLISQGISRVPMLNLDLLIILSGNIEKNFGILIPPLLKCPPNQMIDGVMNVKLTGPAYQFICQ